MEKLAVDWAAAFDELAGRFIVGDLADAGAEARGEATKAIAHHHAVLDPEAGSIGIASLYGGRTREPYVQLTWGRHVGQLTPEEAIGHARDVLEAAAAALADATLMRFLQERLEVDDARAVRILADFRRFRLERARRANGEQRRDRDG